MGNFFSSLFSSSGTTEETTGLSKSDRKKFDILKYDGIRAQKIGKLPYAIKCFTEALVIDEESETMSYLVGAYTMSHEPEKAIEVLDRMIEINPGHLNTLFTRVSVLFLLNREEDAIAECHRIIGYDPSNYLAYFLMSRAKKNLGDLDGALDDATKAVGLKEDFEDGYLLRAGIFLLQQNGAAALTDAEHVIACEGDEETAYMMRGDIHSFMKNIPGAEEDFNKVLELNPFNEDASLKLADLLYEAKRYDEALVVLDELIDLSPSLSKAYMERGKVRNQTGDTQGAAGDLAKAEELQDEVAEQAGQADFSGMYKGGIF